MAPLPFRAEDLARSLSIRASISSIAQSAHRSSSNLVRRAKESSLASLLQLSKRQDVVAIPTTYSDLDDGPSPGEVVGIVLGSVAGFLLLLWLLYALFNFGGSGRASTVTTEIVRERRGKSRASRASRATRSRSRGRRRVSETVERVTEIRESRRPSPMPAPPPPAPGLTERVIVEERREMRTESRPPPPRRLSSDEVVVIEEHSASPPPRRKSSRRHRERGPSGGYRLVDPMAHGGGSAPMREMSRKSSTRRSRG